MSSSSADFSEDQASLLSAVVEVPPTPSSHLHRSEVQSSDIVTINVCGMIYQTLRSTLERYPDTLLGDPVARSKFRIGYSETLFFDRNRSAFEKILYFYQSDGVLIPPSDIPLEQFEQDLKFFRLKEVCLLRRVLGTVWMIKLSI